MELSELYRRLDAEGREALAERAGISPGYLTQLANGWRRPSRGDKPVKPSIDLICRLAAADKRLKVAELVAEFAEEVTKPL